MCAYTRARASSWRAWHFPINAKYNAGSMYKKKINFSSNGLSYFYFSTCVLFATNISWNTSWNFIISRGNVYVFDCVKFLCKMKMQLCSSSLSTKIKFDLNSKYFLTVLRKIFKRSTCFVSHVALWYGSWKCRAARMNAIRLVFIHVDIYIYFFFTFYF